MTYLDANASEPLRPEARAALLAAAEVSGNPASIHAAGRAARRLMEDAREVIAAAFGARPAEVVFTSGATEANAAAIHALGRGRRVLIGATEHDAVRASAPSASVVPVMADGRADLSALRRMLGEGPLALVCLMAANNETGVLHPIEEASAICRAHGALLHVDAAQVAGRLPWDFRAARADSAAVSAHKLGGPLGVGALLVDDAMAERFTPLIAGGGQERGRRGGTPALAALAGFAAAARAAVEQLGAYEARLSSLRRRAAEQAVDAGAIWIAREAPALANTLALALPGIPAVTQVIALDLAGVAVSAGAACSSGKVARSHVLDAMGLGDRAGETIRVSLPWNATEADVAAFGAAYSVLAARLARRAA